MPMQTTMQTNVSAREAASGPEKIMATARRAGTNGKLHLLSLYGDLPASVRARRAAGAIARLAGPLWKTTSEMWKIDSLQISAPIREMITNDAANADVIIVAASSFTQSEPVLIQWLESLKDCKGNRPVTGLRRDEAREPMAADGYGPAEAGLLVGLLGDEETSAVNLNYVVKPLLHCAQQTDRNFIWHLMESGAMNDSDWLADGVNELLARKSAAQGSPGGVGPGSADEPVSGNTPPGKGRVDGGVSGITPRGEAAFC